MSYPLNFSKFLTWDQNLRLCNPKPNFWNFCPSGEVKAKMTFNCSLALLLKIFLVLQLFLYDKYVWEIIITNFHHDWTIGRVLV